MNDQRATSIPVLLASAAAVGMLLAGCTSGTEEAAPQSPSPSAPPPPSASPTPTVPPELAGLEEGWERGLAQPGSAGFVASSRNSVGGDSGTVSTWDDQVLKPGKYTLSFLCAADTDTPPTLQFVVESGGETLIDEQVRCDRGIIGFPITTPAQGAVATITSADGAVAAWAYAIVKA
jgi:hypothetical protein